MKKILIFLNGRHTNSVLRVKTQDVTFPFIHKSREHPENTHIFAADNGFARVLKENIKYSKLHLFGDFDSISPAHLKKSRRDKNIILNVLPQQKDMNDFGYILDFIQNDFKTEKPYHIEIYGGLGKDKDHEYANIKEAEHFLKMSKHGGIVVFQGSLILSTISFAITHVRKKNFSLFCAPHAPFSVQNALYSGTFSLLRASHGLSNAIIKSPLIIEKNACKEMLTLILRG